MFRSSKNAPEQPPPEPTGGGTSQILLEAFADLASTLDVDEVLDRILVRSLDLSGAERALVLLQGEGGGLTPRQARRDGSDEPLPTDEIAFSTSIVRRALSDGVPIVQELGSDSEALAAGQSVFDLKLRSVMCAPLRFRDRSLGAIYLDSKVQHKVFTGDDRQLFEALGQQAAIALQNAQLMAQAEDRARMARELELASEIQQDLLPQKPPAVPGLELDGRNEACEEISGDFFDFIPLADGRVAVFVADVTGHGVGPALLAAEARGEIRALLPLVPEPGEILDRVHENLRATIDPGRFLTLFLAILDVPAAKLTYANAGHPPALLWKGAEPSWLGVTGPPLGVDVEAAHGTLTVDGLSAGDGLLIYSDGLIEARHGDAIYGEDRLAAKAIQAGGSAVEQVDQIMGDVVGFRDGPPQDDSTVVVALWTA